MGHKLELGDVVEAIRDIPRNRPMPEFEIEDVIKKETQLLVSAILSGRSVVLWGFDNEKYESRNFRKAPDESWIDRKIENRKVFLMPIPYIVDHLDDFAKGHMDLTKPDRKEEGLTHKIDHGFETIHDWPPIKLYLRSKEEVFSVEDGITRLRYSLRHKISHIRVELGHGF